MTDRVTLIRERLTAALAPIRLEIRDDSAKHAGHAGARGGGGHFIVDIVSPAFAGKSLIQRHRMVYEALGEAMQSEIHALSIQAGTPDESAP
ncbi:BolA family protein [Thiohalobacter sp. IOR34]|uniref:BolA family protein n=1 Tax=Thiohalobacter sp. IOR34 TaxID=3057176 RepID=UPI0025B07F1C|nr:BolA family protein [Thiohalobacter sp. IOR34]WJW76644.1 BolA family protein [Thiohalobacter sp. IOR34]